MDKKNPITTLLLYLECPGTEKLAYYSDWKEAFLACPSLEITPFNIFPWRGYRADNFLRYQWGRVLKKIAFNKKLPLSFMKHDQALINQIKDIKRYELIILLHSTNADTLAYIDPLKKLLAERKGKLIIFVGNEYNLLPEKLKFIEEVAADFIATQLPRDSAEWLYSGQGNEKIILAPHALNEKVFRCFVAPEARDIDIGFIGDRYHLSLGDTERDRLIDFFMKEVNFGLKKDIRIPQSSGSGTRLPREKYVRFLNSVKATITAESGTYYLDKTGKLQGEIENYIKRHPGVSFAEVYENVIKVFNQPTISGKTISSRHFEAIGTKTCQILLEGGYSGILKADVHYISLKKDFSNIDGVIRRFKDPAYRSKLVDSAHEYALQLHTYRRRVQDILNRLTPSLSRG